MDSRYKVLRGSGGLHPGLDIACTDGEMKGGGGEMLSEGAQSLVDASLYMDAAQMHEPAFNPQAFLNPESPFHQLLPNSPAPGAGSLLPAEYFDSLLNAYGVGMDPRQLAEARLQSAGGRSLHPAAFLEEGGLEMLAVDTPERNDLSRFQLGVPGSNSPVDMYSTFQRLAASFVSQGGLNAPMPTPRHLATEEPPQYPSSRAMEMLYNNVGQFAEMGGELQGGAPPPQEQGFNSRVLTSAACITAMIQKLRSSEDSVKREAMQAIRMWAASSLLHQRAVAAAGAIVPLVDVLRTPSSTIVWVEAAQTLASLAINNEENKAAIGLAGAIPPLVNLLGLPSREAREAAVGGLSCLARNEHNKQAIMDADAVTGLVRMLTDGDNNSEFGREAAANVLAKLAVENDANKKAIGHFGAIPYLIRMVEHGSPKEREVAAGALANLIQDPQNALELVGAGGVEALSDLLDCKWEGARQAASAALTQVSVHEAKWNEEFNLLQAQGLEEGMQPTDDDEDDELNMRAAEEILKNAINDNGGESEEEPEAAEGEEPTEPAADEDEQPDDVSVNEADSSDEDLPLLTRLVGLPPSKPAEEAPAADVAATDVSNEAEDDVSDDDEMPDDMPLALRFRVPLEDAPKRKRGPKTGRRKGGGSRAKRRAADPSEQSSDEDVPLGMRKKVMSEEDLPILAKGLKPMLLDESVPLGVGVAKPLKRRKLELRRTGSNDVSSMDGSETERPKWKKLRRTASVGWESEGRASVEPLEEEEPIFRAAMNSPVQQTMTELLGMDDPPEGAFENALAGEGHVTEKGSLDDALLCPPPEGSLSEPAGWDVVRSPDEETESPEKGSAKSPKEKKRKRGAKKRAKPMQPPLKVSADVLRKPDALHVSVPDFMPDKADAEAVQCECIGAMAGVHNSDCQFKSPVGRLAPGSAAQILAAKAGGKKPADPTKPKAPLAAGLSRLIVAFAAGLNSTPPAPTPPVVPVKETGKKVRGRLNRPRPQVPVATTPLPTVPNLQQGLPALLGMLKSPSLESQEFGCLTVALLAVQGGDAAKKSMVEGGVVPALITIVRSAEAGRVSQLLRGGGLLPLPGKGTQASSQTGIGSGMNRGPRKRRCAFTNVGADGFSRPPPSGSNSPAQLPASDQRPQSASSAPETTFTPGSNAFPVPDLLPPGTQITQQTLGPPSAAAAAARHIGLDLLPPGTSVTQFGASGIRYRLPTHAMLNRGASAKKVEAYPGGPTVQGVASPGAKLWKPKTEAAIQDAAGIRSGGFSPSGEEGALGGAQRVGLIEPVSELSGLDLEPDTGVVDIGASHSPKNTASQSVGSPSVPEAAVLRAMELEGVSASDTVELTPENVLLASAGEAEVSGERGADADRTEHREATDDVSHKEDVACDGQPREESVEGRVGEDGALSVNVSCPNTDPSLASKSEPVTGAAAAGLCCATGRPETERIANETETGKAPSVPETETLISDAAVLIERNGADPLSEQEDPAVDSNASQTVAVDPSPLQAAAADPPNESPSEPLDQSTAAVDSARQTPEAVDSASGPSALESSPAKSLPLVTMSGGIGTAAGSQTRCLPTHVLTQALTEDPDSSLNPKPLAALARIAAANALSTLCVSNPAGKDAAVRTGGVQALAIMAALAHGNTPSAKPRGLVATDSVESGEKPDPSAQPSEPPSQLATVASDGPAEPSDRAMSLSDPAGGVKSEAGGSEGEQNVERAAALSALASLSLSDSPQKQRMSAAGAVPWLARMMESTDALEVAAGAGGLQALAASHDVKKVDQSAAATSEGETPAARHMPLELAFTLMELIAGGGAETKAAAVQALASFLIVRQDVSQGLAAKLGGLGGLGGAYFGLQEQLRQAGRAGARALLSLFVSCANPLVIDAAVTAVLVAAGGSRRLLPWLDEEGVASALMSIFREGESEAKRTAALAAAFHAGGLKGKLTGVRGEDVCALVEFLKAREGEEKEELRLGQEENGKVGLVKVETDDSDRVQQAKVDGKPELEPVAPEQGLERASGDASQPTQELGYEKGVKTVEVGASEKGTPDEGNKAEAVSIEKGAAAVACQARGTSVACEGAGQGPSNKEECQGLGGSETGLAESDTGVKDGERPVDGLENVDVEGGAERTEKEPPRVAVVCKAEPMDEDAGPLTSVIPAVIESVSVEVLDVSHSARPRSPAQVSGAPVSPKPALDNERQDGTIDPAEELGTTEVDKKPTGTGLVAGKDNTAALVPRAERHVAVSEAAHVTASSPAQSPAPVPKPPTPRDHAAAVLVYAALGCDAGGHAALASSGGIGYIIRVLAGTGFKGLGPPAREAAAAALMMLAASSEQTSREIRKTGGITPLVGILTAPVGEKPTGGKVWGEKEAAAAALVVLAGRCEEGRTALIGAGGVRALVTALQCSENLRTESQTPGTQTAPHGLSPTGTAAIAQLLSTLAVHHPESRSEMTSLGVIQPLVQVLTGSKRTAKEKVDEGTIAQEAAAAAVANLVQGEEKSARAVVAAGAIAPLVRALETETRPHGGAVAAAANPGAQLAAMTALASLVRTLPECQKEMVGAGAVGRLMALVGPPGQMRQMKETAALVLTELATDDRELQEMVGGSGAIGVLVGMLNGPGQGKMAAARALSILTSRCDANKHRARAAGADVTVLSTLKLPGQTDPAGGHAPGESFPKGTSEKVTKIVGGRGSYPGGRQPLTQVPGGASRSNLAPGKLPGGLPGGRVMVVGQNQAPRGPVHIRQGGGGTYYPPGTYPGPVPGARGPIIHHIRMPQPRTPQYYRPSYSMGQHNPTGKATPQRPTVYPPAATHPRPSLQRPVGGPGQYQQQSGLGRNITPGQKLANGTTRPAVMEMGTQAQSIPVPGVVPVPVAVTPGVPAGTAPLLGTAPSTSAASGPVADVGIQLSARIPPKATDNGSSVLGSQAQPPVSIAIPVPASESGPIDQTAGTQKSTAEMGCQAHPVLLPQRPLGPAAFEPVKKPIEGATGPSSVAVATRTEPGLALAATVSRMPAETQNSNPVVLQNLTPAVTKPSKSAALVPPNAVAPMPANVSVNQASIAKARQSLNPMLPEASSPVVTKPLTPAATEAPAANQVAVQVSAKVSQPTVVHADPNRVLTVEKISQSDQRNLATSADVSGASQSKSGVALPSTNATGPPHAAANVRLPRNDVTSAEAWERARPSNDAPGRPRMSVDVSMTSVARAGSDLSLQLLAEVTAAAEADRMREELRLLQNAGPIGTGVKRLRGEEGLPANEIAEQQPKFVAGPERIGEVASDGMLRPPKKPRTGMHRMPSKTVLERFPAFAEEARDQLGEGGASERGRRSRFRGLNQKGN